MCQFPAEQQTVHHIRGPLIYFENKPAPPLCFIRSCPGSFHSLALVLSDPHHCHHIRTNRQYIYIGVNHRTAVPTNIPTNFVDATGHGWTLENQNTKKKQGYQRLITL